MKDEKLQIDELASEVLAGLLNINYQPKYLTQRHKENSEYYEKFQKEFEKGLTYEQTKDLDSLISILNSVNSTEYDYMFLRGMQTKVAIDKILKDPLKILQIYSERGTPAREIYKTVKEKKSELEQ